MSFALRSFAQLPLIAVANGMGMAALTLLLDAGNPSLNVDTLWAIFWFTTVVALVVGLPLAALMIWAGKAIPEPKAIWLVIIGAATASIIPLVAVSLAGGGLEAVLTFGALGAMTGFLWWNLAESRRPGIAKDD